VLTEATKGMKGAIQRAQDIVDSTPAPMKPQQLDNRANKEIHRTKTAIDIWTDTAAKVHVVISGIGTGGTITGVGQVLKEKKPSVHMIALEPEDSPILSGGQPGPHKIQGLGAGFVPAILDRKVIDEVMTISNETAFETARKVARMEGIPVGISSGAAIAAALEVGARPEMEGKMIVTVIPSFAERYLSTALFEGL
jgi:cysteine synthase A